MQRRRRPPPIERRYAPPPGIAIALRAREERHFRAKLAAACLVAAMAAAAAVLNAAQALAILAKFPSVPVAVGMITALALYLHVQPAGARLSASHAARKAVAGGVFGLVASTAGAGFGLNENLQTAAAGVGGAKGPEYLDQIAKRLNT